MTPARLASAIIELDREITDQPDESDDMRWSLQDFAVQLAHQVQRPDPSRLQEIRDRYAAIIPGPWRWFGNTETDQMYLGTTDRGRLFILQPALRREQYVHDSYAMATYPLEEARQRARELWCPQHREGGDAGDSCLCDRLRDWLSGDIAPEEGSRWYDATYDDEELRGQLVRGLVVRTDLRFADKSLGERRAEHGGMMRSYRDFGARYEVLGYRTIREWEADQGGVVPGGEVKYHLYREDFAGIDHPEATFIEHAPEDVAYLLECLAVQR